MTWYFSVKLQLSDFWGQLYKLNEFDGILDKVDADTDLHITNIRYISQSWYKYHLYSVWLCLAQSLDYFPWLIGEDTY